MTAATPTKKATSTSTAVAKKPSGAVISIQEMLKAQAASMNERVQPAGGNRIRANKGKFVLPDGTETDKPLELVIVDFVVTHKFYEDKYDPKNIVPPACFAIGSNPNQMVPSNNAPNKQCDTCRGCPMNEFGSDGNGKACKNGRLLAVLPPDATESTPLWLLEVSPTAIKGFDGYVGSVARLYQMPPVGVVTTVQLDPNVEYAKLTFSDPQPNENLELCFSRQEEAKALLQTEPDVSSYKTVAKPTPRKVVNRR
jgi:hypothetical protein